MPVDRLDIEAVFCGQQRVLADTATGIEHPLGAARVQFRQDRHYCRVRFEPIGALFATYQNAGVRVFDITDPFAPREIAHFVPPAPEKMVDPRPNRPRVIQSNDVYVAPDGLMYVTDVNDGLTILQYKG